MRRHSTLGRWGSGARRLRLPRSRASWTLPLPSSIPVLWRSGSGSVARVRRRGGGKAAKDRVMIHIYIGTLISRKDLITPQVLVTTPSATQLF